MSHPNMLVVAMPIIVTILLYGTGIKSDWPDKAVAIEPISPMNLIASENLIACSWSFIRWTLPFDLSKIQSAGSAAT